MKLRRIAATLFLAEAIALGQSSATEHTTCMQRLAELSQQVVQLQFEVATQALHWRTTSLQTLEAQLERVAAERVLAEQEEKSNRDDAYQADIELSRKDLAEDEKAELQTLRNTQLAEGQVTARQRQHSANQAEVSLRDKIAREKAVIEELQKRIRTLQAATTH